MQNSILIFTKYNLNNRKYSRQLLQELPPNFSISRSYKIFFELPKLSPNHPKLFHDKLTALRRIRYLSTMRLATWRITFLAQLSHVMLAFINFNIVFSNFYTLN